MALHSHSPKIRIQKAIYSGSRCCVPGCNNRQGTDKLEGRQRSYYRFPKDKGLKAKYEAAVRRDNWQASLHDRICSDHFIGGKKTHTEGTPGYLPAIFKRTRSCHSTERKTRTAEKAGVTTPLAWCEDSWNPGPPRKSRRCLDFSRDEKTLAEAEKMSLEATTRVWKETGHDYVKTTTETSDSELTALHQRIQELEEENLCLKEKVLTLDCVKDNEREFQRLTGIANYQVFQAVSHYLYRRTRGQLKYWRGSDTDRFEHFAYAKSSKPGRDRTFSFEEEFFLLLVKLKLGDFNQEVARKFGISEASVSKILTTWMNFLPDELKLLFEMKSSQEDFPSIPPCYDEYPGLQSTIDCTELQTERSSTLQARKETYSNYKSRDTVKFMVGLSPNMTVNYVSRGYGGRASDKHITMSSADFLNALPPSSKVMADKGFNVEKELKSLDVELIIPAFKGRNRSQMSAEEATNSEKISRARIHVERIIQRIRTFHILNSTLKLAQQNVIDQMFQLCAYLTNFQLPIKVLGETVSTGRVLKEEDSNKSSVIDIMEGHCS